MTTRNQTHPVLETFRGTAAVGPPRPTDGREVWARDWATSPTPGLRPAIEFAA